MIAMVTSLADWEIIARTSRIAIDRIVARAIESEKYLLQDLILLFAIALSNGLEKSRTFELECEI